MHRGFALLMAFCCMLLSACGGAVGGGLRFDPVEDTPTRIFSSDGLIELLAQPNAFNEAVRLTLSNRTAQDSAIPGGTGRSLRFALELRGEAESKPQAGPDEEDGEEGDAAQDPANPAALQPAAPLELTVTGLSGFRAGVSVPLYTFNSSSRRYEQSGASAQLQEDGTTAKFSLTRFGRYALYGLLPGELLPPAPGTPRLLAASTQVRRLAWDEPAGAELLGVNLYRAAGGGEFSKLNTAPLHLTETEFVDYLAQPGAYRYRLTAVNSTGLESEPGPVLDSPAVEFDLIAQIRHPRLRQPASLCWDSAAERLLVADPQASRVFSFNADGSFNSELAYYRNGLIMLEPAAVACAPDSQRVYIADAARRRVYVLDQDLKYLGEFGSRGGGPGEFERPAAISAERDRVIVADSASGSLQVFTPLGVYLRSLELPEAEDSVHSPAALLALTSGRLLAADAAGGRLLQFDAQLSFDTLLGLAGEDGEPLLSPGGLAEDFRQRLYISDTGNRRVVVLGSGGLLFHFGSEGSLAVELGADYGPAGLAYDPQSGYLYVADPGNRRIAVFAT